LELNYYRPYESTGIRSTGFLLIGLLIGLMIGLGGGVVMFLGSQGPQTQTITTTSQITVTRTGFGLVEYAFSPGGKCANLVIKWIGRANSTIHVLIYSFTLDIVRDALIQAKNRGVDVKIVMEKQNWNGTGSEYMTLKNAGITVRLDSNPHLMHDKVAIIDGHIILTGSFNWSAAGNTDNDENLVVLDNQTWASAYEAQFQIIYSKAT
jgi:phosphatidylserine/phosphatidylglycerophosphate/cardiolipin synthase-like enzyme